MIVNKDAKRILLFGDSLVFGKIPVPAGSRYDSETRFTGIIQKELGDKVEIIEEGLRGRVIEGENAFFPYRNGAEQFGPIFGSHYPIDLLILFMGTNDTNSGFTKSPGEFVNGFDGYLKQVDWWCEHFSTPKPQIMLVAPPLINEKESYKAFKDIFKGSEEKSKQFSQAYEGYATKNGLYFLDSTKLVAPSSIDGIHLSEEGNLALGKAIAKKISELLW